ncbi:hypothetical protein [Kribbella sp. VKM Ac-2566]|uniref:hypothetical protein n=1 Tax=Kribbella sp. VKM Ac-2566 TaxID=2512218 RepID=UPI001062651E|nr:hypothetical protein [Kribbella sp. VKM Ac-2566]
MFEEDLESLPTRDLLEGAAECRAIASRADARLLECAQIYADRFHPSVCEPRPTRRAGAGRERAAVLGGDGCPEIAEFAIAEFAVVIGVSPGVGRDLLADALALRHRFPRTWTRIQAGDATPWKARQIVRACTKLDHAAAEYVDRKVAAIIDTISPYRLEKIARAARHHADPTRATDEATDAADDRGVHIGRGDAHGNKTIYIKAAAAAVNRCNATITDIAEALQKLGDTRPVQHRRAEAIDILADPRFTQELLTQAHNQPQPTPPDPATTQPDPNHQPHTNHEPHTPTTPDNPAMPNDAAAQDNSVVQHPVVRNDAVAQHDAAVPNGAVGHGNQAVQDGPAVQDSPTVQDNAVVLEPADPLAPPDSLERPGSLESLDLPESPRSTDLLEPGGPPDDPWLEATAPYDPDPPTDPFDRRTPAEVAPVRDEPGEGPAMDAAALRSLRARLAQIKNDAYANPSYLIHPSYPHHPNAQSGQPQPGGPHGLGSSGTPGSSGELARPETPARPVGETKGQLRPGMARTGRARTGQARPGQTEVVVHLTDRTLATGNGVLRAETIGPLLATQLAEVIGYGPYTVKPVIDLNDAVSVDAYEIPTPIRERVKLIHPVELFPYGTRETTNTIDLDHIEPYDPHGPTGQTSTKNLAPLGRFGHRVKTHARGWTVHRIDYKTLEWTTPHGFTFHVDPTGTHRVDPPSRPARDDPAEVSRRGEPPESPRPS